MSSIDVIVPCYGYARYLKQCVESVLRARSHSVRVLVIDDASPDNTAEIGSALASADARVTFVRHSRNRGHIATYNEGIDWVAADYMLLLSADDYLMDGALERAVAIMGERPDIGFVFGNAVIATDDEIGNARPIEAERAFESGSRVLNGCEFLELIAKDATNIVPTPTVVVRTKLQKALGGYRAELPHSGDMEMWMRLASCASVGMIEAYQAVWRRHGENMQKSYYARKSGLPDLEQRKAAIECFLHGYSNRVHNGEDLCARMFRQVGRQALMRASAAFNEGDEEESYALSRFAVEVSPEVRRSLRWMLLGFKRWLGVRKWGSMQLFLGRSCGTLKHV